MIRLVRRLVNKCERESSVILSRGMWNFVVATDFLEVE